MKKIEKDDNSIIRNDGGKQHYQSPHMPGIQFRLK